MQVDPFTIFRLRKVRHILEILKLKINIEFDEYESRIFE